MIAATDWVTRYPYTRAYDQLRRLCRAAALPAEVSPHSPRHSYPTEALRLGAALQDLQDLQDAIGHADPRTTRRYDRSRHNLDRSPNYLLATALTEPRVENPSVQRVCNFAEMTRNLIKDQKMTEVRRERAIRPVCTTWQAHLHTVRPRRVADENDIPRRSRAHVESPLGVVRPEGGILSAQGNGYQGVDEASEHRQPHDSTLIEAWHQGLRDRLRIIVVGEPLEHDLEPRLRPPLRLCSIPRQPAGLRCESVGPGRRHRTSNTGRSGPTRAGAG